jgi:hypothetical protein
MSQRDHVYQENLTALEAVERTVPDSTTYAMAMVDTELSDVVYAFNGRTDLLQSVLQKLHDHLQQKSFQ